MTARIARCTLDDSCVTHAGAQLFCRIKKRRGNAELTDVNCSRSAPYSRAITRNDTRPPVATGSAAGSMPGSTVDCPP